jgi:predicted RNA-binding protein with PIN domain
VWDLVEVEDNLMTRHIMVLDAYNILHRIPHWAAALEESLEMGRQQLLRFCQRWIADRGDVWLFCVVFDGDSQVVGGRMSAGPGVRMFFSRTGESADDRLLEIIDEYGPAFRYTVVSDDRYVQEKARLLGADLMGCRAFSNTFSKTEGDRRKRRERRAGADTKKLDGASAARITEELRRLWVDGA